MHTDDTMHNLSCKALSNDGGAAGSCDATVQQNLAKLHEKKLDRVATMVHYMVYLNYKVK